MLLFNPVLQTYWRHGDMIRSLRYSLVDAVRWELDQVVYGSENEIIMVTLLIVLVMIVIVALAVL